MSGTPSFLFQQISQEIPADFPGCCPSLLLPPCSILSMTLGWEGTGVAKNEFEVAKSSFGVAKSCFGVPKGGFRVAKSRFGVAEGGLG